MTLKLYNTLTRTKQDFAPLDAANVRMYVCGPTVYDYAHIGNARPVIVFDVLFRLLRHLYGEEHVTYVRNITDIDDKINARARDEGVSIRELTERTATQFHKDIGALGVLPPTFEPRATETIAEMVTLIERLIAGGHAYVADGHVLFDVPSMSDYGRLSRRSLDEMIAGARVDVAPYKRGEMDFVLWKPSDAVTPGWESPWGRGRPGWHIECSAMSWKHLGERFDIHGGGIDLIFPHHENEIAQTRCAFGSAVMANIWMHNGFLQVEGQKMSKSLGNFVTINELLKDWPGEVLRFNMLKTHYRSPIDWTVANLHDSANVIDELLEAISDLPNRTSFKKPPQELIEVLSDDLNTSDALHFLNYLRNSENKTSDNLKRIAASLNFLGIHQSKPRNREVENIARLIWDLIEQGLTPIEAMTRIVSAYNIEDNRTIQELTLELWKKATRLIVAERRVDKIKAHHKDTKAVYNQIRSVRNAVLHGSNSYRHILNNITNDFGEIQKLLDDRKLARLNKDWPASDQIRDRLATMGVLIKDNKDGTTTWEVKR